MTTGVQVFLMAFGAILALIGVVVFFLLAWFKETTGQDHQNAIKILQAFKPSSGSPTRRW
jgi:hypothetical protein